MVVQRYTIALYSSILSVDLTDEKLERVNSSRENVSNNGDYSEHREDRMNESVIAGWPETLLENTEQTKETVHYGSREKFNNH